MDRSKNGPPEVPHRETSGVLILRVFWAASYFFEGVLGDLRGSGEGVGGGPLRLIFGAGLFFGAWEGLGKPSKMLWAAVKSHDLEHLAPRAFTPTAYTPARKDHIHKF